MFRLTFQVPVFGQFPEVFRFVALDGPRYLPCPCVVSGGGQIPTAELVVEILEVSGSGDGGRTLRSHVLAQRGSYVAGLAGKAAR